MLVPGGNFRDILIASGTTVVSFGTEDRLGQNSDIQTGCGQVVLFFNGSELDVCSWLTARFPGPGELADILGGAGNPGQAEALVDDFDHNFLASPGLPGPAGGGGGGGGGTNPPLVAFVAPPPVNVGDVIQLNAAASDPDDASEPLKFVWTVTDPLGGQFGLTGPAPSFVARLEGNYTFDLVVTDDTGLSTADSGATIVLAVVPNNVTAVVVAGN